MSNLNAPLLCPAALAVAIFIAALTTSLAVSLALLPSHSALSRSQAPIERAIGYHPSRNR